MHRDRRPLAHYVASALARVPWGRLAARCSRNWAPVVRPRLLLFVVLMAGAVIVPVSPVSAAPIRECGDLFSYNSGNITAKVVTCTQARRLVKRVMQSTARHFGGMTCRRKVTGYEGSDIRCTGSGGRVVRWQAGA